ncbi:HEAT repeat domain-containing protein [Pseudophaeobacter sp.]|uniref:HEAT repeat domain-containing protein n=1 Tax=Pseudophaeobacter sp. TaxID=1971739 RepID=UPI0032971FB9
MLTRTPNAPTYQADPVPVLLRHLETGNDVIRIGAVRALAAQAPGDARARLALLAALRDEDPDVRSDVMDVLGLFSLPEDADLIRESLIGDPVREVKQSAITLLADLQDKGSIPLFRALAQDRCEDQVAWEDGAGLWDEWLEIQTAVICALGALGATETLQDLLAARDDETGQNLDLPVFGALANMGSEGLVWLLSVARTETGLARKRALEAMAALGKDALCDHVDYLFGDQDAAVRRLVLPLLEASEDRAAALALMDPDAGLRAEALSRYVVARPELAVLALADDAARLQAIALDHLPLPLDEQLVESLPANMQAWLDAAEDVLVTAVVRNWFRLLPAASYAPLLDLIRDETKPLEARIAAVEALAGLQDDAATERLISLLSDPAQQVRLVALTHLIDRAQNGNEAAIDALALAAEGVLLSPDAAVITREAQEGVDATADHDDLEDVPRLRIDADGEVVASEEKKGTGSTLEAIQLARVPAESSKKGRAQRKRRAVEGSAEVAQDLARVSLGLIGQLDSPRIVSALLTQASGAEDVMRIAAFRALAAQPEGARRTALVRAQIARGLMDRAAAVRASAAEMASQDPELQDGLTALMGDEDAMVRKIAVPLLQDPAALLATLDDRAAMVRSEALARLRHFENGDLRDAALRRLVAAGRIDTLQAGMVQDNTFRAIAVDELANPELTSRDLHVLLGALAHRI